MYDQFFNSRVVSFNLKGLLFSWHNYSVWMKRFPFLELLFELRLSMIPSRSRWLTTASTCSRLFTALVVQPGIALVLTWHSVAAPVAPPAPVYCPSKSPNPPYIDPGHVLQCVEANIAGSLSGCWLNSARGQGGLSAAVSHSPLL